MIHLQTESPEVQAFYLKQFSFVSSSFSELQVKTELLLFYSLLEYGQVLKTKSLQVKAGSSTLPSASFAAHSPETVASMEMLRCTCFPN